MHSDIIERRIDECKRSICDEVGTHCRHIRWGLKVRCCYCDYVGGK